MKKTIFLIILGVITTSLLTGCSKTTVEPTVVADTTPTMSVIVEGRLLPLNSMDHSFKLPGEIAEILVEDGELVKKGQPLARLENTADAEAALAQAQLNALNAQMALNELRDSADYYLAQAQLEALEAEQQADRAEAEYNASASDENKARLDAANAALILAEDALDRIENGDGVDPDALSMAELRLSAAEAAVSSTEALLDSMTLKAALDGTVVDIGIQPGQQVATGVPVLAIADYSGWLVKTDTLTEMEVTKVEVGQEVEVILDAIPGLSVNGKVIDINSRFEEKRGDVTYTATILLDGDDPQMRWGMTAAVYFLE